VSADEYLHGLLAKYAVNEAGAKAAGNLIYPVLEKWSNGYLNKAEFSGSLAKGTGISISTDADIFLSLTSTTPGTLADMYSSLYNAVAEAGYVCRKQDVSIGVTVNGYLIDLVPGRRQSQYGNDHSLYRNRASTWTQTNVETHISYVVGSARIDEIRLLKIWRTRHGLTFPSFYLELAVIDGLHYARYGNTVGNIWGVLEHLRDNIETARYVDPANTNNVVSQSCTQTEKAEIAAMARASLGKKTWQEIVW
jgi:hypothetical protein